MNFGMLFRLFVDLDINVVQMLDGILLQLLFRAEFFESDRNETKLGANLLERAAFMRGAFRKTNLFSPVTEVVHGRDTPTCRRVEVGEEGADNRRTEMADVKLLRNVGRAIFCAHGQVNSTSGIRRRVAAVPITMFFPFPLSFWPYNSFNFHTVPRVSPIRLSVRTRKCTNGPWCLMDSMYLDGANCRMKGKRVSSKVDNTMVRRATHCVRKLLSPLIWLPAKFKPRQRDGKVRILLCYVYTFERLLQR